MIEKITDKQIPLFQEACRKEPILGSRCMAALRCYGLKDADVSFWLCRQGDRVVAALALDHDVLTCVSDGDMDPEELLPFLRSHGVTELDSRKADCEKVQALGGGEMESSWFMRYEADTCPAPELKMHRCGDLHDVLSVLQQSHPFYQEHYTYETWSKDVALRIEKGESEVYILELDGRPIGTGTIGSEDETVAVVSAIAVIPAYRHKGIGTQISRFLTCRALEKGRMPALICGYDEVGALYRRIGYTEWGHWGELYL